MTPAAVTPFKTRLLWIPGHKPSRQRLHETHKRVLFCVGQAEVTDAARVHVGGRLGCRPACRAFIVMWLASRQNVACVVEMHDLLQAREISVMSVGLHKGRIGPLVHIAQSRHLNSRLVIWRQLQPSRIHRGGLAEQMPSNEKSADAAVDE